MTTDRQRLEALKRGLAPAGKKDFVAITAHDLRWLIELAESQPQPFVILDQAEGEEEEDE